MCDTISKTSNIEGSSSYVLTQDMIDAAMTEQFSYQDDNESEGEVSSANDTMDFDVDVQSNCSAIENTNSNFPNGGHSSIPVNVLSENENSDSSARDVLVIETGLVKSFNSKKHENITENLEVKKFENEPTKKDDVEKEVERKTLDEGNECQSDVNDEAVVNTTATSSDSQKGSRIHLLKRILSEPGNIESIDLCDSDDTSSENETSAVELIDDELKSVMENNLMAEVGITLSNKNGSNPVQPNKPSLPLTTNPPKIMVESVTQISPNAFHSGMWNVNSTNKTSQITNTITNKGINHGINTQAPSYTINKNQASSAIHINKIAIPNRSFVDSKNKMKCIFVKNQTGSPVDLMISRGQPSTNNKTPKLLTQSFKKPIQLSTLDTLKNVTKKHLQFYQPISPQSVLDKQIKPNTVLTIRQSAPMLQKVPLVNNVNSQPVQQRSQQDLEKESFIKSLLFHTLKVPYEPPEVPVGIETYSCVDCKDRFVVQSSLNNHLARRSLVIRYWCSHCRADLTFNNRCVFLKHLRNHNYSIGQINFSNVEVSPLSKQVIDKGVISTFFTNDGSINSPPQQSVLSKSGKDYFEKIEFNKKSNSSVVFIDKPMSSGGKFNPSNQKLYGKLTTGSVQTRALGPQTQSSIIINTKLGNPTYSTNSLPAHTWASPSPRPSVKNSQTQTKSVQAAVQQTGPKSVVMFHNKTPSPGYANQSSTSISNTLPPNKMFMVSESMLTDEGEATNQTQPAVEDEEIDIESVTVDELPSNDLYQVPDLKKERNLKAKTKPLSTEPSKPMRRGCPECGTLCMNISKHLLGQNRPLNPLFTCETCHLVLPTKCGFKLHSRIHLKLPPFKCPDCGKDFDLWQDFHAHLKFSCGHLSKCVRYMCPACKAHFPSEIVFGHHISSQHSRDVFRCGLCPVAFYNNFSLDKHIKSYHPNESVVGMNQKQCLICSKKLVPLNDFTAHIQEHTKSIYNMIYGFKCSMCSAVYSNKMSFIIHQVKEKKEKEGRSEKASNKTSPSLSKSLSNLVDKKLSTHADEKRSTIIPESVQISDSEPEMEEEIEIFRKPQDSSENYPSVPEKDPLSLDGWEFSQDTRVKEKREELCIVCKKNYVYILPGIDLNEQSLCCKQCVKPLDVDSAIINGNSNAIDDHQAWDIPKSDSDKYYGDCTKSKQVEKPSSKKRRTSELLSKDELYDKEKNIVSLRDVGPMKKKIRKKPNKELGDPTNQPYSQGQVIAYKSPGELICSKCSFVADTKSSFLEHISVHRTDPHTYQCLECGLCFVVLPSLERHLQMNHGIKDVHEYIKQNKNCSPKKSVPVEETVHLNDNQCRVCFKECDSPSSLEKHFRTHGMAFMSSLIKSP